MLEFTVPDMTCSHCAGTITRAVAAVDPAAVVTVELPVHRVRVEAAAAGADAIESAIRDAGYTPQRQRG